MELKGFALLLFASFLQICFCSTNLNSWQLQSSAVISASGEQISTPDYDANSWYPVTTPATVLAGLLQNNVYEDVFFGNNIEQIDPAQFNVSWWYRTNFSLPKLNVNQQVIVTFKGINYRANIWVNGKQITTVNETVGTFRYFDFNITPQIVAGTNVIATEIFRPHDYVFPPDNNSTDLAITFVDWSYYPADYNMGLWREVIYDIVNPVSVAYPSVSSNVSKDLTLANLEVLIELTNWVGQQTNGTLVVNISEVGVIKFDISLEPSSTTKVVLTSQEYPILSISNPKLWWPWQMGEQNMFDIDFTFWIEDEPSDSLSISFGIRQVSSEIDTNGNRLYKVNGQNIMIRGAGWSPELFQRTSIDRQLAEFTYVRDMGLNAIRLEGKFENDDFFSFADEFGILLLPGICCCDAWQHWDAWSSEQLFIASESIRSQAKRLRIHPSILVFFYSSDELPPPNVESTYLSVFHEEKWPAELLASASAYNSSISGPTGVKMSGPYSWEPPNYWLLDKTLGGAFGFLTEGGPGENPLPYDSLVETLSSSELWPPNEDWDLHCGNPVGIFRNLRYFNPPLDARYGNSSSAEEYSEKAQVATYESHRALFEGYNRNKYVSTGVIQWMLNNAWPQMIWHLYDFYLNPTSSYFGTKKACSDIHGMYGYDDNSIYIVNSLYQQVHVDTAVIGIYAIPNGTQSFSYTVDDITVDSDGYAKIYTLPSNLNLPDTYFLRISLQNGNNNIEDNVYWMSKSPDVLDWNDSNFYRTPCSSFANFLALEQLPPVELKITSEFVGSTVQVTISNPSPTDIAFFVRTRLVDGDGSSVLPIVWSDNFVSIFSQETTVLFGDFSLAGQVNGDPNVIVEWWNDGNMGEIKSFKFL